MTKSFSVLPLSAIWSTLMFSYFSTQADDHAPGGCVFPPVWLSAFESIYVACNICDNLNMVVS